MNNYSLCSLLFETSKSYEQNLQTLSNLISNASKKSIIVAPEVSLTGFDYENFEAAASFSEVATKELLELSEDKIIVLTMIEKRQDGFFNVAKVFHNKQICYERAKAKLFLFGGEDKYFSSGNLADLRIVDIDGIKIAILICFELRFKELWKKIEGSDVIVAPSWWGVLRTEHFKVLTQALAIMNQCYVIASDSKNKECSKMSGVIDPQGKTYRNGNEACFCLPYEEKEIRLMRRYLDVGIG